MSTPERPLTLEQRVARLEGALGWTHESFSFSPLSFAIACAVMIGALVLCIRGLQMPNHSYQAILAVLGISLAYHRRWLIFPNQLYEWILPPINILTVSMLAKLFLGSGERIPFYWLKYPIVKSIPTESKWLSMPKFNVTWEPSFLALWQCDLTVVQTFLVVVTLVGALLRFQLFASLTAFLLLVFSLPALLEFDWHWVFPAILAAVLGFYIQSNRPPQIQT